MIKTGRRRPPDWWLFFNKFLQQGTAIAALIPSSRFLARAVVEGIDFAAARCIVELGAGTGPITAELMSRASSRCRVIVIERDADFCARLRERFPEAEVVHADAVHLEYLLNARGIDGVDHVLCGLPLPSIAAESRDIILEAVRRRLPPHGSFRQLTNMPWIYYPLYRRYFQDVQFRMVTLNLPPGGVYVCREQRVAG